MRAQSIRRWCEEVDETGENVFINDGRKVQCKVRRPYGDDLDPGENEHIDKFYFGDGWMYISAARPDQHRVKFDLEQDVKIDVNGEQVRAQTRNIDVRVGDND